MKLGLLGDIHAEDGRLHAALQIFRREGVDSTLFVGDVADGTGDLDRCCALLRDSGALGVRGNHDRWLLEGVMRSLPHSQLRESLALSSLVLLASLPAVRDVDTPLGRLLLCHGVGANDMGRLTEDDHGYALESNDELRSLLRAGQHALAVGGHTHQRMVRKLRATDAGLPGDLSMWFVNPGTLARDATPCCAILDCLERTVQFFDLEDPASPFAVESRRLI